MNIPDEMRGEIAYALTKRLVIDMPTARAAVDEAADRTRNAPDSGGTEPVAWVSAQSWEALHKAGSHVAVRTAIHREPLRSGNGVPLFATPPAPGASPAEPEPVQCERCQGNGEIITDWDRYLHCHEGDKGDEAVAECPDCDGTGYIDAASPACGGEVGSFQQRVQPWMMACFGSEISADKLERGDRLAEEVLELLQSGGYPRERVAALIDYVYEREVGKPAQEVGGVMVTLAAYCLAHGLDMHECGETELARVWTKIEKIRAKQAAKPTGSALPAALTSPEQGEVVRVLKTLVWTARTSGGTAGPDPELITACENAEAALAEIGGGHAK